MWQPWVGNNDEGLQVLDLHTGNPLPYRSDSIRTALHRNNNFLTGLAYVHAGKELFIGQQNGLDYVDVTQLHRRSTLPPVVVTSFRVHERERPIDPARPIRLTRSDNAFSVDLTTLTYRQLANTRYPYFLEGLDERWNYSGSSHRAYYTNLGPGKYSLQVKAVDSFGNRSRKPLRLTIEIMPAYYETWLFKVLIIALTASILYGLYRYRINQLMRVLNIRNRISADLHDEIGSSLSGIGILGTMIR